MRNPHTKPDPYCAFTDDNQRRLALQSKVRAQAVTAVAVSVIVFCTSEKAQWLINLLN